ncbi:MAG: DUF4234 domain-containing protein [Sandaracinaceae bacterium]
MGYRNETEQLRAKVERLEAQVGAIRGQLSGDRTSQFGARVRRQLWLIGLVSVFASGVAWVCVIPMGTRYVATEHLSLAEAVDRPVSSSPADVIVELAVDRASVGGAQWGRFAAAEGEPHLLVYCEWDRCPDRLMNGMVHGMVHATRTASERYTLVGALEVAEPGYAASGISAGDLAAYAASIDAPVESIRVFTPSRSADPAPAFWFFLVFAVVVMLSGAGAFWLQRRAGKEEVELPRSDDFLPKSPAVAVMLCVFTGVYQFYWVYRTTSVLRRLTGRPDLVPAVDLILSICTLGFWNFWAFYRNAEAIDELYEERGDPSRIKTNVLGYCFASLICSLAYVGAIHELQSQCNRLAVDQGEAMRDALDDAELG